jgi:hypothetical protein
MNFKETKFAYRHKPTGKWVRIDCHFDNELWDDDKYPYVFEMELMNHITDASIEPKNSLRSSLKSSIMNGERYAAQNFLEFELVEVEIEYRVKQ